ncbi:hypothetical protein H0H81_008601 [Sphagnurus paluster]|uniref:Uncharacterized protein n=1 Tax=Sphagnurus paluster TaxID=117069 RepID=A0A9P7FWT9_9AGAR|nr:hypothetical protein H0H81_008601 [Sphagnurus paluster]
MYIEQKNAEAPPLIKFKLLLIGSSSVGKSSLLLRFYDREWDPENQFWSRLPALFALHQFLMQREVYDILNHSSFEAIQGWYDELAKRAPENVVIIIVGNKVDEELSRQVSTAAGKGLAAQMSWPFLEASAKTGAGVEGVFECAVKHTLATPALWEVKPPATIDLKCDYNRFLAQDCRYALMVSGRTRERYLCFRFVN